MNVLDRFKNLFDGLDRVYGMFEIDKDLSSRQEKVQGKAVTMRAPVTIDLFQKHISGDQGLGLVPIRDDQTCMFGALDIDDYTLDLLALNTEIQDKGMPLVLCRTKSGGAHCYLFMTEPLRAEVMRNKLQEFSEGLGYSKIEIFPKQRKIKLSDNGSWINLPYFDAVSGEFDRFAYNAQGRPIMDLSLFVDYAEHKRISPDDLKEIKVTPKQVPFGDGPPCLQHLAMNGFPEGTRNTGLLNMGVYAMKKHGDDWEIALDEMNRKYMSPPLPSGEVVQIQKSLTRKEYSYTCEQAPLCNFCHKQACFGKKYGIGGGGDGSDLESMFGELRKSYSTDLKGNEIQEEECIWFLDVDGVELQLTTGELFNQDRFRAKCAERLRKLPLKVRPPRWDALLKEKVENAGLVHFDPETGTYGHIVAALKEFCTRFGEAETRDDIMTGKVWANEEGAMHFRHEYLWKFLLKAGIYRPRDDGKQLQVIMKKLGARKKQLMINRAQNLNKTVWVLDSFPVTERDDEVPEPKRPKRPY